MNRAYLWQVNLGVILRRTAPNEFDYDDPRWNRRKHNFLFHSAPKGCYKKILSQRCQVAKNLIPKPKNPPRRTSQRVFSARICVKKIPRTAAYREDHNPVAILHLFCIAPEMLRDRHLRGSKTILHPITPGFTGGHRSIDPSDLALIRCTKTIFSTMSEIQLG